MDDMRLDASLKALPDRRAPRTLAAAVLLRARPWHSRPWWTWNAAGRAAFASSVALSAALLALALKPLAGAAFAHLGWAFTLASLLSRLAGPALVILIAVAAVPTAALVYIKENA